MSKADKIEVKDLLEIENANDYAIQMSCYYLDYTKKNLDEIDFHNGKFELGDGLEFVIAWGSKYKYTLQDFKNYIKAKLINENEQLISWDEDDGNMIEFKNILVSEKTKKIVLC